MSTGVLNDVALLFSYLCSMMKVTDVVDLCAAKQCWKSVDVSLMRCDGVKHTSMQGREGAAFAS
jgi:hypothetical protein